MAAHPYVRGRTRSGLDESWAPRCVVWMLATAVVVGLVLLVAATVRQAVDGLEPDVSRAPQPPAAVDAG